MDKLKELLAALLITRQVMGNIKESIIPYFKKEMKLAKLSFDLYGALSPTTEDKKLEDQEEKENLSSSSPKIKKDRILSQVELESSAPDVSFFLLTSSNYNLFSLIYNGSMMAHLKTTWRCSSNLDMSPCFHRPIP